MASSEGFPIAALAEKTSQGRLWLFDYMSQCYVLRITLFPFLGC
jgi:hypothetical protein